MKSTIKKLTPKFVFGWYHLVLAFFGALAYGFPSKKIFVLGITGTKGKTSVVEITNAILEEAGFKTAISNSLRFKIDKDVEKNLFKMTMPGRFFIQKFLKSAVKVGCKYALIEVTSEGVLQFRHKFIEWDAALFTNLAPEHIESHGSFENYRAAKLEFFNYLKESRKKKKTIIVNADDAASEYFSKVPADEKRTYGIKLPAPSGRGSLNKIERQNLKSLFITHYSLLEDGTDFVLNSEKFHSNLVGEFNLYNILAAISFAQSQGVGLKVIKRALAEFKGIPGRMEFVQKKPFKVVIDYAHTPDSLEQVYQTLSESASKMICVLGSCGGGRDKWKRPEMGQIAGQNCDEVILTNEDPYDEDPNEILNQVERGVLGFIQNQDKLSRKEIKIKKILNRKEAIQEALKIAASKDVVIITGKGAEPLLMGPRGSKIPWDDREIAREGLENLKR